jgi:Protein of unknown function (DUF1592)/Protein of unknown function (DUF1588)/Protein of unknown function (DUF1595)/Protein of unknown function (DUF1585)/Protein of unknown function (DUF1587)
MTATRSQRFSPQASAAARFLCAFALTASAACSGTIEGPSLPGAGSLAGSDDGSPGSSTGSNGQALGFQPAPVALRKLTVQQYQNTVRDLLGVEVTLPELETDTAINGFFSIGAAQATVSPSGAEKFETAAYALAAKALAPDHRQSLVKCTPSGPSDASCTGSFVSEFGRRAFRRPLVSEEVSRYVAVAQQAQRALGDFYKGLEFAVAGMLQSPDFLFRAELGSQTAGSASMRPYDDYELATRLSYLLWNTTPDDALLAAASRGELSTPAGLNSQAERLLADPRAKVALDNFHSERLSLDELGSLDKLPSVYAAGVDDALKAAMRDDVLDTIEDYTFGANTDFRDLFTSRVAFVDSKLAAIYGLPASTRKGRVELPTRGERVGILGKAAFLAVNAHTDVTSPTKRGKYIRERLLCQGIPAPPPDVSTVLPEPDPSAPTMRERLEAHVAIKSCAGCHTLMDPLGLSFEHFDAIGRFRKDDAGNTLDVSGNLNGSDFDGALELSELLRDEPRTSECVARQVYRYATAHVETDGEEPAVQAVIDAFASSGYRFTALLRAVIASEGFRFGAKE